SPWIPHPGATAPKSRKPHWMLFSPLYTKVATGFLPTTHLPPFSVDSHIVLKKGLEKSSKKMCGVPWLSMTMLENCSCVSEPLTNAGDEKRNPAPGECDSRIAEENGGTVAFPSTQGFALQKSV